MDKFPPEIFVKFFSSSSADSILRFREVHPGWRRVINDPYFVDLHQNITPPSMIFQGFDIEQKQVIFSYNEQFKFQKLPAHPHVDDWNMCNIIGTSNGIVCTARDDKFNEFTLWNPNTRAYLDLPTPKIGFDSEVHSCVSAGFAFNSEADDYLLVRIIQPKNRGNTTEVETLSTNHGHWVNLALEEFNVAVKYPVGIVSSGTPYWIGTKAETEELVWFDIENMNFVRQDFPWPKGKDVWFVGDLWGYVCVFVNDPELIFNGFWLHKQNQWTKVVKVDNLGTSRSVPLGTYGEGMVVYLSTPTQIWMEQLIQGKEGEAMKTRYVGHVFIDYRLECSGFDTRLRRWDVVTVRKCIKTCCWSPTIRKMPSLGRG